MHLFIYLFLSFWQRFFLNKVGGKKGSGCTGLFPQCPAFIQEEQEAEISLPHLKCILQSSTWCLMPSVAFTLSFPQKWLPVPISLTGFLNL